jgi:hypothetical protein
MVKQKQANEAGRGRINPGAGRGRVEPFRCLAFPVARAAPGSERLVHSPAFRGAFRVPQPEKGTVSAKTDLQCNVIYCRLVDDRRSGESHLGDLSCGSLALPLSSAG